jgi:predicted DNA-binding protein with PD1-like motif
MEIVSKGSDVFLRLDDGDELIACLTEVAKQLKFNNAAITSGLGMVESPNLAFYHSDTEKYAEGVVEGQFDMATVTGSVTHFEGQYKPHVHITFNNEQNQTFSGHVIEAKCHIIMEIFLRITELDLVRVRTNENNGTHITGGPTA